MTQTFDLSSFTEAELIACDELAVKDGEILGLKAENDAQRAEHTATIDSLLRHVSHLTHKLFRKEEEVTHWQERVESTESQLTGYKAQVEAMER